MMRGAWRAFWWGFTHPFSDAREYARRVAREGRATFLLPADHDSDLFAEALYLVATANPEWVVTGGPVIESTDGDSTRYSVPVSRRGPH